MKKNLIFLLILSLSLVFIKPVSAQEVVTADPQPDLSNIQFLSELSTPVIENTSALALGVPTQEQPADLGIVVLNTARFEIKKGEVIKGKKIKAFNNQLVFQIEEDSFNADAVLELKELALGEGSQMVAPNGFQLASRIYEYNLIIDSQVITTKPFWFSVKYLEDDYFRKTMYYFDEQKLQWIGIESLVNNGSSKIVSKTNFKYAKVAILDDLNIMSEGVASWYKYKSCNCAASPDYPKGTKLKVTNIDNGKSIIVKVNDWGPDRSVHPNRVIDLDIVAFKQIAKKSAGLCKVKVELAQPITAALTK